MKEQKPIEDKRPYINTPSNEIGDTINENLQFSKGVIGMMEAIFSMDDEDVGSAVDQLSYNAVNTWRVLRKTIEKLDEVEALTDELFKRTGNSKKC